MGEHRLHVVAAPLRPAPKESNLNLALAGAKPVKRRDEDMALLRKGELDVEGMGRILEGMTNGAGNGNRASVSGNGRISPSKRRRVGFA